MAARAAAGVDEPRVDRGAVSVAAAPGRLDVCYLLADTPLFGGVKVVLAQANLLHGRGHRVLVASPGPRPDWFPLAAEYRRLPDLSPASIPHVEVTVATYWSTIGPARAGAAGEVVHYCQGYERSYTHNEADHPAIDAAYAAPLPAIVVAPHLACLLAERYGRPARVVKQPLERAFRPRRRLGPGRPARVLVAGPYEIDWKGVATALDAVRGLRESGIDCRLVRLSQWPLVEEERRRLAADEVHVHMAPAEVARLVRGCDLLLAPSWEQEGFGLPVLEAMASGVPVVASDVSCFRDWAAEAAPLVPPGDPGAFARAAAEILASPAAWRRLRRHGLRVAAGYRDEAAARSAEEALGWVASGAWRADPVVPRGST